MAMIDTAHTVPFGAVTIYRYIGEPVARLVAWFRNRAETVRTADALGRLSPEMLEDIGLTTADVVHYRGQSVSL